MTLSDTVPDGIAARVAAAVRAIAAAASDRPGADCIWHALACRHLLVREGQRARLAAGYAAWRVHGRDPGAVVCHHAEAPSANPADEALAFHTWAVWGGRIFDTTAYQLRGKMAQLDATDGGRTPVSWCPDYLLVERRACKPLKTVRDGFRAGLFCYEEVPAVAARVLEHPDTRLDDGEIVLLEEIYALVRAGRPLAVVGPCGIGAV